MMECKSDCLFNIDGKCTRQNKKDMTVIEKWKNDFKSFINELSMPEDDFYGIMQYIDEVPNEPKTGHWIYICNSEVNGLKIVKCSECGKRTYGSGKYCPNCGARMIESEK